MQETERDLERNSRTLRESRRGQHGTLLAILGGLAALIATAANAGVIVQLGAIGISIGVLIVTYPRWGRIKTYRREDHREGRVRKPAETEGA